MRGLIFYFLFWVSGSVGAAHDPLKFLSYDRLSFETNSAESHLAENKKIGSLYKLISSKQNDLAHIMSLSVLEEMIGFSNMSLYPTYDFLGHDRYLAYHLDNRIYSMSLEELSGKNLANLLAKYYVYKSLGVPFLLESQSLMEGELITHWEKIPSTTLSTPAQSPSPRIHERFVQLNEFEKREFIKYFEKATSKIMALEQKHIDVFGFSFRSIDELKRGYHESLIKFNNQFLAHLNLDFDFSVGKEPWIVAPKNNAWEKFWKTNDVLKEEDCLKASAWYLSSQHYSEKSFTSQIHLTPINKKTLVITPVNDREGKEIKGILEKLGMDYLGYNNPSRSGMSENFFNEIVAKLKEKNKYRRLVLIELPPREYLNKFQSLGIEIVLIDHHYYKDMDLWHPLSSLEQFAELVGYDLTPKEKLVGVFDRAGVWGLKNFIPSAEDIKEIYDVGYENRAQVKDLNIIKTQEFGSVLLTKEIESLSYYNRFVLMADPIKNIIAYDPQKGFNLIGDKDFLKKIKGIISPYKDKMEKYYAGGDKTAVMYWSIRMKDESLNSKIFSEISEAIPEIKTCNSFFTK